MKLCLIIGVLFISTYVNAQDTVISMKDSVIAFVAPKESYNFYVKNSPPRIGEWAYGAGDGDNFVVYVNTKNILKDYKENKEEFYKIWIKIFYLKKDIKGMNYENIYSYERIYIDCKHNKFRSSQIVYYDNSDKLIDNIDFDEKAKWEEPVLKSIGEGYFKKACELIKNKYKRNY